MAFLLPVVLCGGGMALCMWLMSRGMNGQKSTSASQPASRDAEMAELRDELTRLRAEVEGRDQQPT